MTISNIELRRSLTFRPNALRLLCHTPVMILMLAVNSQNVDYSLRLGHSFSIDERFFVIFFSFI